MEIEAIAHIETRRAGEGSGQPAWAVVFEPRYRDRNALRGIEDFSHLWLIWAAVDSAALELTPVAFEGTKSVNGRGTVLLVSGEGLEDGATVFDIKPYVPYTDAHGDAHGSDAREDAQ